MADHDALMWAEVADIGELLHECSDDDLDAASLCEGWRVRDVVGHMGFGHTTPMPSVLWAMVRYRGDVSTASFEMSKAFASARTPDELRRFWDDEMVARHSRKGIARTIKAPEGFLDHFVHQQDMRRPLDRPREIAPERLVAALDLLPTVDSKMFSTRQKVEGLALRATDVDWSAGSGPEVRGPGEALVVAAAGRAAALDDLEGDGVAVLAERIGA